MNLYCTGTVRQRGYWAHNMKWMPSTLALDIELECSPVDFVSSHCLVSNVVVMVLLLKSDIGCNLVDIHSNSLMQMKEGCLDPKEPLILGSIAGLCWNRSVHRIQCCQEPYYWALVQLRALVDCASVVVLKIQEPIPIVEAQEQVGKCCRFQLDRSDTD